MKKFLIVTLIMMATIPLQAEQVSVDFALQKAKQFARANTRLKSQSTNNMNLAYTENTGTVNNFYVFNADNEGFVIVSADDCVEQVLGYSENGTFDINNIPDGLKAMLEEYKNEINYAIENNFEQNQIVYATSEKRAIAPMIKTRWNQNAPYNKLCPTLKNGIQPAAGCVATAFAQVMKHYEWPKMGKGSVASVILEGVESAKTVDFSATTYDWDNMLNGYTNYYNETQANAVAELMFHVGAASKMNYAYASGAEFYDACAAFVKNFDYDKSIRHIHKRYYTTSEFNDLVYNELSNNRPVMYAGYNITSGHAFVCDGYSSDNMFHINWGWGGMSDGYFRLSALSPSSQGTGGSNSGYNSNQEIIYNIKPNEGTEKYWFDFGYSGDFSTTASTIAALQDEDIEFTHGDLISVYAPTREDVNLKIGVEVVNNTTNETTFFTGFALKINAASYEMNNVKIKANDLRALGNGDYTIYPAYENETWGINGRTKMPAFASKKVAMNIADGVITFTNDQSEQPKIAIEKIEYKSKFYLDNISWMSLTLKNSGADFSEPIYPLICSMQDKNYIIKQVGNAALFEIGKGNNCTGEFKINLDSGSLTTGNYYLMFARLVDGAYSAVGDTVFAINVDKLTESTAVSVKNVIIKDCNAVDASKMQLDVVATCTSGYFCNELSVMIMNESPPYAIASISGFAAMDKGKTYTIPYTGSFDGEPGMSYIAVVYAGNDQVSDAYRFTVADQVGIEDVELTDHLLVYPNPAEDVVNVTATTNVNNIEVFSLDGKMVMSDNFVGDTRVKIDVDDLAAGIYVLKVHADGQTHMCRIIKK